MRLNQIKLAGFKSFAEPTTFQLPGQRVGVVGPNGCGKSNIMDAVRWVLGESKASELRGESMQDVIFNGSGQRKPASRASVELVFDNSDGRAGGPWNAFQEIAVRRVLTRDGTSSYSINNQTVRRRDVQDVFLGTGLGPRAYAIIGQGTISRIIESRPEELRLFLEEAAGVSKYKERRRETENRLKDTRENLTRVEDILRELEANLGKLERQAEVAARYTALQDQATLKQHQLWFLRHRDATDEEARVQRATAEAVTALEARTAELRHGESELETVRQAHYGAGDRLHLAQGAQAEAALQVSRLEERIRYVVDSRERVQQRIAELRASNAQWAQRQDEARAGLEDVTQRIEQAQEHGELLGAQAEELGAALPAQDDAWRQAQSAVSEQRLQVAQVQQQIQLLAAQSRSLDEQERQLQGRRERLVAERHALAPPDTVRLEQQRASFEAAQAAREAAEARLHVLQEELPALDERRREQQAQANHESARQAEIAARLGALRALQEKVQTEGRLQPWLARHGLQGLAGLWTRLHVEPGWEAALESALRERLNALEISRLDTVRAFATDAPPARLAFYHAPVAVTPPPQRPLPRLADKLRLGDASLSALLTEWLEGVYTAATLEEALAQRASLAPGESILTPEGHTVSLHAVAFYAPDSEQAGMLARAQEIENLDRQLRAQALLSEDARAALVRLDAAFTEGSQQLAQARREATEAQARAHQLQVELLRLTQQAEAAQSRRTQLGQDLDEIDAQVAAWEVRREEEQGRFDELDIQLGTEQERLADCEEVAIGAERRLAEARQQHRSREREAQEAAFEVRALNARAQELQREIQTAEEQARQATQAGAQLEIELGTLDNEAAQAGLQEALALRLERERALASVRSEYDDLSARLRAAEEQRLVMERSLDPLRERIQSLQLQAQAARLGGGQYLEQLTAAQVDLQAVAASIEQGGVRAAGLQGEIDRLQREVAALGPVNLAALQELAEARERKGFLDAQHADLLEAITTLENAIRRIDLETRDLLRQTFDQVNDHFGRLFPTLFGGGSARLVMTGDEILDAGVQVMAQPPGKRNSTIHLLSGGEKALTAIALVFAIFHLNPAPFCLLDEVDAPLDDANTERYARLVNEMSQGTQFLFISHNRIAMEMAEQLIGVTMQEQGVSRIVAVDMQAAVGLAEAA
jgi:chromosome segregation protein